MTIDTDTIRSSTIARNGQPDGASLSLSRLSVILALGLAAGCTTLPGPLPRAPDQCWTETGQWVERIRSYPDISEAKALDAAANLLRLAGHDTAKITRSAHSISSEFQKSQTVYLVLVAHSASVREQWVVATQSDAGGTSVCVDIRGQYFTDTFVLGAEPITHAVYPASVREREPGKFFRPPAQAYEVNFDTFWARFEYLAGQSAAWADCPSAGGLSRNERRGRIEMDPLCHSLAGRAVPRGP